MLKDLFDASEAQEFGKQIAETFSASYPMLDKKKENASGNQAAMHAKLLEKQAKVLGKLTQDTRQFGQTHKLNFYKKAKLSNAFKWALMEKGFDTEFVDQLTKEVILSLK
jgi:hypothetical protein